MKALILAAGRGRRLGACGHTTPKCLLRAVGEATILDLQLRSLRARGIRDVIVAVGHMADRVQQRLEAYPELSFTVVTNPDYATSNTIYTLHLCRHVIDDDMVIVHGDLVFESGLLDLLLAEARSSALVSRSRCEGSKDFVARIEHGRVQQIGVGLPGPHHGVPPLYAFAAADMRRWMEAIGDLVAAGHRQDYAEDALNPLLGELYLQPCWFSRAVCMEVDTVADLRQVRRLLAESPDRWHLQPRSTGAPQ